MERTIEINPATRVEGHGKITVHDGTKIQEGMFNRVEAVIRAFDPCLSSSTHAMGRMPLRIQLVGPRGEFLDEVRRE
jgi:NAD-reducing hydrogenase large subunit